MSLAVLTPSTDFDALAPSQLLTLALLAVALRPLLEEPGAEFVRFHRRDLFKLVRAAGLRIPLQRFTAELEALAGAGDYSPAVRLIRSGGIVRVVLGRPLATAATEEAWRHLLVSQRLRGLGLTIRTDLARSGFDSEEPLPGDSVARVRTVPAIVPDSKRCPSCDRVRAAVDFGTTRGRINSECLECK